MAFRLASWPARFDWLAHVAKSVLQDYHTDLGPRLKPYIPRDGVVIDVGAHSGQLARIFGRLAPEGRVYAFEPGSYALSVLRPALWAARLPQVEIVPLGLAEAPGEAVLHMPVKKHGGYGYGLSHLGGAGEGGPTVEERIPLTTLDAFAEARSLERLDFLKADVEGWEIPCLRGGRAALARFRPVVMLELVRAFCARAGAAPEEAWTLLAPLGYRAFALADGTPMASHSDGVADYLFLPERLGFSPDA